MYVVRTLARTAVGEKRGSALRSGFPFSTGWLGCEEDVE